MTDKEAMKLALEALEWCHGGEPCGTAEAIIALKEALAQPEQKPVGKIGWAANVPNTICEVHWTSLDLPVGTELYTTPPQREWVGLTLEQYVAINSSCTTVDQAVGSTERQLKENNT
jgi:hypothetical protein